MSMPPNLMPGMGGPPPAPMSGPGLPGGGPDPVLAGLALLQQSPPPEGEKQAMQKARNDLGMAMSRIWQRSPEAARNLADAIKSIDKATKALQDESQKALPTPPDLGMSGGPMAAPSMGGGMGGGMGGF